VDAILNEIIFLCKLEEEQEAVLILRDKLQDAGLAKTDGC